VGKIKLFLQFFVRVIVDNFTRVCYYNIESIVKHSTLKEVVK
jgi:hypothetical protein